MYALLQSMSTRQGSSVATFLKIVCLSMWQRSDMARMTEGVWAPWAESPWAGIRTENFATYQTASSDFTSLEYGKQS